MLKLCVLPPSFANCCWLISSTAALWVNSRVQPSGQLPLLDQPARQALAMGGAAGIGADGVEHFEERPVALPVLLGQIADNGREVAPGRGSMGELRAEKSSP